MAKELTITVNAKLDIDKQTAETCLKIVELYVNQNGLDIIGCQHNDGTVSFEFHGKR